MVRTLYVDNNGTRKGAWSEEEDNKLKAYILRYGHWNWRQLPKFAGLSRCGKSCRLRWMNYLKPGLKRGSFSHEEEELVIRLHNELGKKWSAIAAKLPGRTDNEIKNYWHTHLKKGIKQNTDGYEPIAQPNYQTDQPEAEQNKQLSEAYHFQVPQKEDLTRGNSVADSPICLRNSETFPVSGSLYNPSTKSSSLSSIISPHLGGMELVGEDSITSLESFVQPLDSFWTEPFFSDTLSSECNNSVEFSEDFMYPYSWYTEDGMDILDQFMEDSFRFQY